MKFKNSIAFIQISLAYFINRSSFLSHIEFTLLTSNLSLLYSSSTTVVKKSANLHMPHSPPISVVLVTTNTNWECLVRQQNELLDKRQLHDQPMKPLFVGLSEHVIVLSPNRMRSPVEPDVAVGARWVIIVKLCA